MNPQVDEYINKADKWQAEMQELQSILLECGLTEELKWGVPCYTFRKTNVILIGKFKDYCTISFLKGVLLQDAENLLVSPGENSQSARIIKFTELQGLVDLRRTVTAYVYEAIEIEKAGLKVDLKESKDLTFSDELIEKFAQNSAFQEAFEALTPGRQRAYNMFFVAAKQSKTRETRIEKYIPRIMDGKGINDCVCGLSKRMPNCDGSHKYI